MAMQRAWNDLVRGANGIGVAEQDGEKIELDHRDQIALSRAKGQAKAQFGQSIASSARRGGLYSLANKVGSFFVKGASGPYVAYHFWNVPGLLEVFDYEGTGAADGPNVVCGFKPRWIMLKQIDASRSWLIYDTERNEYNPVNSGLYADLNNAESSSSTRDIDITANGFKIRGTANTHNTNGGQYIGLAIADVAGGGNLPAILGN